MGSKTPPDALPLQAPMKKENEEEIKEFAETAMNELLGWYGYERLELRRWAASRAKDGSSPEHGDQRNKDECTWCSKRTREGGAIQHAGSTYCSELCFSQSRRANFKRAKTCDWCRHVRHTVAYVDFQDGATQLQFCSDKCLNQYKMQIFCRETQAHLDLNPHLVNAASSSNLITPDLWLRNCRSRSTSPASEKSRSPNPDGASNPSKSKSIEQESPNQTQKTRKSPIPLISVTSTAKLMKKSSEDRTQNSPERKKDGRLKMNLRRRRTSKCSATVTSQSLRQRSTTPKAQDLRMRSPSDASSPLSNANSAMHSPPMNHININHLPMPPPSFPNPMFAMPPSFMENGHDFRHPMFSPRLPTFLPRPGNPGMCLPDRFRPPISFPQHTNQPPPVTVLVPYPVILPIPLPIPIPMPMSSFIQAHRLSKVKTEAKYDGEGPLDFTINGGDKKNEREDNIDEICEPPPKSENRTDDNHINQEVNERLDASEIGDTETRNPEQTLPKFKITRIGNKMAKIVTKPREVPESNRPLRKRRRLVEVVTEDDPLSASKTRKTVEV